MARKQRGGSAEGEVAVVYNNRGLYSVKLEEDDTWYRLGREDISETLGVEKGDIIAFEWYTERNQSVVDIDTIEILEKGDGEEEEAPPRRGRKASGGGKRRNSTSTRKPTGRKADSAPAKKDEQDPNDPNSWARKDLRITMMAARNAAVETMKLLLEHDAIKLPAKTKVAERHEVVLGVLDNLTAQFYMDALATQYEDYEKSLDYISTRSADVGDSDYYGDEPDEEDDGGDYGDD